MAGIVADQIKAFAAHGPLERIGNNWARRGLVIAGETETGAVEERSKVLARGTIQRSKRFLNMQTGQPIRREHSRLRLGINAKILGFDGPELVILYDLSKTGAKFLLEHDHAISKGVLGWLDFEAFGEVVWQKGRWCGMQFDKPITDVCLLETREASPALKAEAEEELRQHAKDFVTGKSKSQLGL
jgi:hypothetical protein